MISKKLQKILLITLLLIYLHGLEEIISGTFAPNDPWMAYFGNLFETKTEVFYWTFHLMWWLLVPIGIILLIGKRKWVYGLLVLFGSLYIIELHHVVKGIMAGRYYPGMITGIFYPLLGFFYWKELLKEIKRGGEGI